MRRLKVLIASRLRDTAETTAELLERQPRCTTDVRILSNGHVDPLHNVTTMPDLLLLCDIQAEDELRTLTNIPAEKRPPLIVFGAGQDPDAIRRAMRAGARDYLSLPLNENELFNAIEKIADEVSSSTEGQNGRLHVFMNGKGGSGASFLAANVAHGLATNSRNVTLVDLDMQFVGLCRYLDLTPERDLVDAMQAVDEMDELAARAFTSGHESGLRLLSCLPEKNLRLTVDVLPERLIALLQIYQTFNDFVVVDLPRHIDLVSAAVLENADEIAVVTQQSFPHLHDTARLLQILRSDLGVDESQITVIVNRFDKSSRILLADIEKALKTEKLVKIPNHYAHTSESVNSGIPLMDITRRSAVTKKLAEYCQSLAPAIASDTTSMGALQRLFRRT
jgi:pilus assembly protein CpaE